MTFFFFILALTLTTVANTLVTMSILPFIAAIMAWIMLKEPIRPRTWAAMGLAAAGLVVMFADSARVVITPAWRRNQAGLRKRSQRRGGFWLGRFASSGLTAA